MQSGDVVTAYAYDRGIWPTSAASPTTEALPTSVARNNSTRHDKELDAIW